MWLQAKLKLPKKELFQAHIRANYTQNWNIIFLQLTHYPTHSKSTRNLYKNNSSLTHFCRPFPSLFNKVFPTHFQHLLFQLFQSCLIAQTVMGVSYLLLNNIQSGFRYTNLGTLLLYLKLNSSAYQKHRMTPLHHQAIPLQKLLSSLKLRVTILGKTQVKNNTSSLYIQKFFG